MFFLELSCFFDDPADVGNLISGFSAFSKKPAWTSGSSSHIAVANLENFDHYFTSMRNECNCAVIWTFFGIVFGILWHCIFTASAFRIWNSSTRIPSPPLVLFVVMLPKAHSTSHSKMSGSWWVIASSWLSGPWRSFLYSYSVYSCHLFLISSASVRLIHFCPLLCPSLHEMFPWCF